MEKYLLSILGSSVDYFYESDTYPVEGDFSHARTLGISAGGCPLNVGAVCAATGRKVYGLDMLGKDDDTTDFLLSEMKRLGYDTSHIEIRKDVTNGKVLIILTGDKRTMFVIDPKRPPYTVDDRMQDLLNNATYIYSLMHMINRSFENIEPLLEAKRNGARIILDGSSKYDDPSRARILYTLCDGLFINKTDYERLSRVSEKDPVEMIPKYVHEWENGYKIVIGIKKSSQENKFMYWLRGCYYKLIKKLSDVEQIEQFTGFGLYDKRFIKVLRELDDPTPFLRGIVAELGFKRKEIPYEQPKRRAGKTSNNLYRLFDAAMLSITSYTKVGLRCATIAGCACAGISMIVALIYLVMKLIYWDRFAAGMAPLLIGMCLLGSIQMFFIGLVGEYILTINARVMKRPLVVEEERLNFEEHSDEE